MLSHLSSYQPDFCLCHLGPCPVLHLLTLLKIHHLQSLLSEVKRRKLYENVKLLATKRKSEQIYLDEPARPPSSIKELKIIGAKKAKVISTYLHALHLRIIKESRIIGDKKTNLHALHLCPVAAESCKSVTSSIFDQSQRRVVIEHFRAIFQNNPTVASLSIPAGSQVFPKWFPSASCCFQNCFFDVVGTAVEQGLARIGTTKTFEAPRPPSSSPSSFSSSWSNCTGRSNASWALGSPQFRTLAFLQPIQARDFPKWWSSTVALAGPPPQGSQGVTVRHGTGEFVCVEVEVEG